MTDFQEINKCLFRHNIIQYLSEILPSARPLNAYKQTSLDEKD